MEQADAWSVCRVGFVEVVRAVTLALGDARAVRDEWGKFDVVEVDQTLVEDAAALAIRHGLRSLDALHLASALALPRADLSVVTADQRLAAAARAETLAVIDR